MNPHGIDARKAELLEAHRIRWEFGINDPTFLGWFTVGTYLLAAWLAWRAANRAATDRQVSEGRFWTGTSILFVLLAINKQLDLQVLLTDVGRYWAVQHDLYQQRRVFQQAFMAVVALAGSIALAGGFYISRGRDAMVRWALLGIVVVGSYILIRAASFHHTDRLFRTEVFGVRWNWIVELAGLAIAAVAAWRYRAR